MASCPTCNSDLPEPPPRYCEVCGIEVKTASVQHRSQDFATSEPSVPANQPFQPSVSQHTYAGTPISPTKKSIWQQINYVSKICFVVLMAMFVTETQLGIDIPDGLIFITFLGASYFFAKVVISVWAFFSSS